MPPASIETKRVSAWRSLSFCFFAGSRGANAACRRSLEPLVDRDHPVAIDSLVNERLDYRLRYEGTDVDREIPRIENDIQSERHREIAEGLAIARPGGITTEIETRSGDASLQRTSRKRHRDLRMRGQAP